MPERQTGSWTVSKCTWRCFYQSAIKSPTLSLTFHQNEISWLFFIVYYFCESWILSCELKLSKGKNFEETLCLQPWRYVSILLHLHLYANSPSFSGFRWRRHLWFPRCLPFWAPYLFWLSRFSKFRFRLFIPTFSWGKVMRIKCCNWIKSHNTL